MKAPAHKIKEMENNGASVLTLIQLLLQSISDPTSAPEGLHEACKAQGKLAKFSCVINHGSEKPIVVTPMSLNTFKKTADRVIVPGGFQKLDTIRCEALNSFSILSPHGDKKHRASSDVSSETRVSSVRVQQFVDSVSDFADRYNDLLRITRNIIHRASEGKFNRANEERILKQHLERALALPKPHLKIVES